MTALTVRTTELTEVPDLLAVSAGGVLWHSPALELAGRGTARRLEVDRTDPSAAAGAVADALHRDVEVHDELRRPGTGPLAIGAWPFRPDRPGQLVLPEVVLGRSGDGTAWVTTALPAGASTDDHHRAAKQLTDAVAGPGATVAGFSATEPLGPASFSLRPTRTPAEWCDAVAAALGELRSGAADKVVLARDVVVTADDALPVTEIVARLAASFPDALRWAVDGFVGASPELLVARTGDVVRAHPLAGTAPRTGDPATDERVTAGLRASAKNQAEHRHTIDLIHETLLPYCSYLDEEAEPSVVNAGSVTHLGTAVEGRLSSPHASVVELVCALHPTPAVCGRPRDAAMALIEQLEGLDRGRYAGPVGWVDAHGNGEWAVGIRSVEIDGPRARCFAGVGVVADSEPAAELAETRAKLQVVLDAVVRP
jgi:menaquinone-specific isochorismate synthase